MRLPRPSPPWRAALDTIPSERAEAALRVAVPGQYLHWDDLVHRAPPEGLSREQWWAALKLRRALERKALPFADAAGRPFGYVLADSLLELLHRVDRDAPGQRIVPDAATGTELRDRLVIDNLMEEAIASSQLEGASTTHAVAKEMLRTGRSPRTPSERMILNGYAAMRQVRELRDRPLAPDDVIALQRTLTEDTMEDGVGRLRTSADEVVVQDDEGQIVHRPPPADQLRARLGALCEFAEGGGEGFVHPLVRAIVAHFWLAYDHPFTDGNGRTARALFYWTMLRHGYRLAEFLPISPIVKSAPARYARSFLLVEDDDNDVTYFLLEQARVVRLAIDRLGAHVEQKRVELTRVERALRHQGSFNHRQLALLSYAIRHPDADYTIESHRRSHGVSYLTARADLQGLEEAGLIERIKRGRTLHYVRAADFDDRLASGSAPPR